MWFGASIEIGGKGCAKVWMGVGKRELEKDNGARFGKRAPHQKIKGATAG
jgi:hypothetical protein